MSRPNTPRDDVKQVLRHVDLTLPAAVSAETRMLSYSLSSTPKAVLTSPIVPSTCNWRLGMLRFTTVSLCCLAQAATLARAAGSARKRAL